jgi:uncharacterized membrane protein YbhN (UPF0104 family)
MSIRKIRIVSFVLASTIFVACAWYLVERFQWREAVSLLLRADLVRLIGLVWVIHFAYICLRTWRWRLAVRYTNPDVGFFDLYWITAVVVSLAILTPGQLGEALKIELLKRRGLLGRLPGLGAFALERILDVLVIAAMGAVGLVFGSGFNERYPGLATGAGILFLLGLVALYFVLYFDPGGRASHWLARMRTGSGSPEIRFKMALLTLLSWGIVGIGWQVSLHAIDIHISLAEIMWLISVVTLGTLVSFIPGGFGVAEVLWVEALLGMGIVPVAAQAGALMLRAYALMVVLFGLAHLALWQIFRRRRTRDDSAN